MALREEDCIRVDRKKDGTRVFVFPCSVCGKEMPKTRSAMRTHTGKCVKCVKRNRHKYQTVYNCMISSIRAADKRFNRTTEINLSFDDFLFLAEIGVCAYCNKRVAWSEYSQGPYNLDRKDNSRGYEIGNVLICCFECNNRKGKHWDSDEFMIICDVIKAYRSADEGGKMEIVYAISELKSTSLGNGSHWE